MVINGGRSPGRLVIRADDPSLTPYAGLAISGELLRGLRLVGLVDAELAALDRVAPATPPPRGRWRRRVRPRPRASWLTGSSPAISARSSGPRRVVATSLTASSVATLASRGPLTWTGPGAAPRAGA